LQRAKPTDWQEQQLELRLPEDGGHRESEFRQKQRSGGNNLVAIIII